MFATASLSVGEPAFFQALFNLSAVTLVVMFLPTFAALAPAAAAPFLIAPPAACPAAAAPFLIAPPAAAALFLIASSGPSVNITAGVSSHHSIIVSS